MPAFRVLERMHKTLPFLLLLGGCDLVLTPVTPREAQPLAAEQRPARVIWLVDMSGSMQVPTDASAAECPPACGPSSPCPVDCETRQDQLIAGIDTLAAGLPATTTHDLVMYPKDALCSPPDAIDENLGVAAVRTRLGSRAPQGGTPTSAALNYVASLPVRAVDTFVVLATDGVPNCNPANPNHVCAGPNPACRCTTTNCANNLCALGCLDDLAAVNASHALAARGYQLMVIGQSPELRHSDALAAFSSLEMALPRTCSTGSECAAGCDGGVCGERMFTIARPADYSAPANRLADAVARAERCRLWLAHEVAESDLRVTLGGDATTEWRLDKAGGGQRLEFTGSACDRRLADSTLATELSWLPGSN